MINSGVRTLYKVVLLTLFLLPNAQIIIIMHIRLLTNMTKPQIFLEEMEDEEERTQGQGVLGIYFRFIDTR